MCTLRVSRECRNKADIAEHMKRHAWYGPDSMCHSYTIQRNSPYAMLLVNGIAKIVVKAGTASVTSAQLISAIDSMKMTAPIRQSMGPVAMDGIELNRGLDTETHTNSLRKLGIKTEITITVNAKIVTMQSDFESEDSKNSSDQRPLKLVHQSQTVVLPSWSSCCEELQAISSSRQHKYAYVS